MIMRRWHRWFALPAAIFLLFIALTGVLLHLDMMRVGEKPPGPGPSAGPIADQQAPTPLPSNEELAEMVGKIADVARTEKGLAINTIQINLMGPSPTLSAGPGGPPGSPEVKIDAVTGRRIVEPPRPADYHYILQNLHAGYILGLPGQIISILCGIALMVLSVTGFQVWWDMRRRLKKGLFWK